MTRKTTKIIALVLMLALALSTGAMAAERETAEPYSNSYIKSCWASISQSGGTVTVNFTTRGTGVMTSIGASTIKIYTSGGTRVKTFYSSSTSSMLGSNRTSYSSSVTYYGDSGTSYYAIVTHYAANSSGGGTQNYTTGTT